MISPKNKTEIEALLKEAQSKVDNVGQWKGTYKTISFWIGDRSGSRVNQYEGIIYKGIINSPISFEIRAKTYSAFIKKVIKLLDDTRFSHQLTD